MDQHVLPKIDDDDEAPPSRIVDELDEEDYEDPPASPLFTMTCGPPGVHVRRLHAEDLAGSNRPTRR
ncbi:hypothetical protein JL721_8863 [Aureococcus anophagefferens]|nr:hypothetical protein JL721_8863 [Aureococcus anophagefferens]